MTFQTSLPLYASDVVSDSSQQHWITYAKEHVVTTTPNTIFVHQVATNRCIASIPAADSAVLGCPAVLMTQKDGSLWVYGAIGSTVHRWAVDSCDLGKPGVAMKLKHCIQSLNVVNDGELVLAVLKTGTLICLTHDLSVMTTWNPPKLRKDSGSAGVVFVQCRDGSDGCDVVQVVKHLVGDQESYCARLLLVVKTQASADIVFKTETSLMIPSQALPSQFAFSFDLARLAVVLSIREIVFFDLLVAPQPLAMKLRLTNLLGRSAKKAAVAMTMLPNDHLAVVSQRKSVKVLTVWELKYGSLQKQITLNEGDNDTLLSKGFSLLEASVESLGNVLITVSSSLTPNADAYVTSGSLIPYDCQPVSLLHVVGKKTAPFAFSNRPTKRIVTPMVSVVQNPPPSEYSQSGEGTQNPEHLSAWLRDLMIADHNDAQFLSILMDSSKSGTVASFVSVFSAWIQSKSAESTLNTASAKPVVAPSVFPSLHKTAEWSFDGLPAVELSHVAMSALSNRCLAAPDSFWPRSVVQYLIVNGWQGNAPQSLESNDEVPSLTSVLIKKQDYELLSSLLEKCVNISETDYVLVIEHVSEIKSHPSLVQSLIDYMKSRKSDGNQMDVDESNDARLCEAQTYFFGLVFSLPRNDHLMVKALRKSLTVNHLESLFDWLSGIINPNGLLENDEEECTLDGTNDNFPLWWVWINERESDFSAWTTAIDALSVLMDSHYSSIILTPDLETHLRSFHKTIKRDMSLFKLYKTRLSGPCLGLMNAIEAANEQQDDANSSSDKKQSMHGRRWRQLVDCAHNGVGDYRVEVFMLPEHAH